MQNKKSSLHHLKVFDIIYSVFQNKLVEMNDNVIGQMTIELLWYGDRIVFKSFAETKDKSFVHDVYNIIWGKVLFIRALVHWPKMACE